MNTIRKSIVIGLTVLGLAGSTFAVQAQDKSAVAAAQAEGKGHGHQHGHKHGHKHGNWAERQAQRAQKLHDALKLTPAQEGAWASYSAAIKPQARPERGQKGAWQAMSAPERMEKRLARARMKVEKMEARLAATASFYATLSPEQKKVFDENSMRRGGHRHHMKHGMAS
ncbi:Spy/CpxP family protein refolding chaperone [Massilia sp. PAMC28688]|uniref:Spy/CpxP family protein refolding chaperone n=1 Tax=Massilia sp. PAMC28688 TaxID=2861283 RepID=UPI001C633A9C|nr:Spy/CpxP family protein refolding chaperone [Massilia sp. PAMC28688]QYF94793.1 Spy/CpxP family protein refolding chaperone [Massilia sp. PAMC28688]